MAIVIAIAVAMTMVMEEMIKKQRKVYLVLQPWETSKTKGNKALQIKAFELLTATRIKALTLIKATRIKSKRHNR